MKTSRRLTLVALTLCFYFLVPSKGWTFVLPLNFVVQKTISTTGRAPLTIEQEVTFKVGKEILKTNESWLIEGDRNLKVSAFGLDTYKENIQLHSLINAKQKTQVIGKNKTTSLVGSDFYQRLLFIRSTESFMQYLRELGISEKVRLSRADGRVCVALGQESESENKNPQIWIDQEDFLIRKIRLPSGAEIQLSDYVKVSNDLWLAKTHVIRWAGATATIKVKSYSLKNKITLSQFYPQNFNEPTTLSFNQSTSLHQIVEDFYLRFR